MNDEIVFDTNIIVYAYDSSEKQKQKICAELIAKVFTGEIKGVVTNQILAEAFDVLTRKIQHPIEEENAKVIINGINSSENWIKVNYTTDTVIKAISTSMLLKARLWDCVIAETMIGNDFHKIYTENTKDFKKISKINPIVPF